MTNHHYLSTFGAAGAVGLISGLAQWLGTRGLIGATGDGTVIIAGGVSDNASQTSLQVMNRFLNRLPTITIREGHRVKVYLTTGPQRIFHFQNNRKPVRCHAMTVSGLTMTSADRQSGQTLHSHAQKSRSDDVNVGRFTERWRTPGW